MKIEACIFDLDGVIVDTQKYHYLAWKRIANELGFELTPEENENLKGVGRLESLEILLEMAGVQLEEEKKLELTEKKNLLYIKHIQKITPDEIIPGVISFIKELKTHQIKIAVVSGSKNAATILERIELIDLFDAVIDATSSSKAFDLFEEAAQRLQIAPEHCVVFEDAATGIQAALDADMKAIGVGHQDVLQKANGVIPHFENFSFERLEEMVEAI